MGVNFRQNVNWRYVNVLKTPFLITGFNLKFQKFYSNPNIITKILL